jgi:capsule polysaccharide export protein KpsE/RkpR
METLDGVRARLSKRVKIKKSKEEIIFIKVEDKDPERAAEIANAFVEELDRINKGVVMTSGKSMRVFVEERLKDAKVELASSEEALRMFQENNRAFKLDEQSKAMIETMATIQGQLMAKELELETLFSYATDNHPQAGILKTQIRDLKETLKELGDGKEGGYLASKDIFIPAARIPDMALRYARYLRDVKVQLTLYELLAEQYEMARILEAKDSPTVQVLDVAEAAVNKSRPRRGLIVLSSTFGALIFAFFLSLLMESVTSVQEARG